MGTVPYSYSNEKVAKIIVPDSEIKNLVSFAFQTFAASAYTIEDVRRMCMEKNIKIGKQQFNNLLTIPFLAGKINLKASEEEEA
jgi:hypothetical protein